MTFLDDQNTLPCHRGWLLQETFEDIHLENENEWQTYMHKNWRQQSWTTILLAALVLTLRSAIIFQSSLSDYLSLFVSMGSVLTKLTAFDSRD